MLKALFALVLCSPVFCLASAYPYSEEAESFVDRHAHGLEKPKLRLILEGAEWLNERESYYDSTQASEPSLDGKTASQVMDKMLADAKLGKVRANENLETLLWIARPQRNTLDMMRGQSLYGTVVMGPSGYDLKNKLLRFLGRAFERAPAGSELLLNRMIDYSLRNPDSVNLAESVTSLLSIHTLRDILPNLSKARDYLLLMSVNPAPEVRMMAHLGLSAFVDKDPEIREFLIATGLNKPEIVFSENELNHIRTVLKSLEERGTLGSDFQRWETKIRLKAEGARNQLGRSRIRDIGDYNVERMANASAAQAIMLATLREDLKQGRSLDLFWPDQKDSLRESVQVDTMLAVPRALDAGNGTGFGVSTVFENEDFYDEVSVIENTITLEAGPENLWAMMGFTHSRLINFFEALKDEPVELHYGHTAMVIAELKHKLLGLPGPEFFYKELDSFKKRLARHNRLRPVELNQMPKEVLVKSFGEFSESLLGLKRPESATGFVHVESSQSSSIFAQPLHRVFAVRALGLFGARDIALEQLRLMLPKEWELNLRTKKQLAENLSGLSWFDEAPEYADLSTEAKHRSLEILFNSFRMLMSEAEVRREIMRWMSGVQDEKLYSEGLRYFSGTCAEALK